MKKILILLSLLLGYVNNQAQGVFFEDLTFKQALEKAKRENKYVLLSLSASWCLPCALMKNEVLTQKVVGDYFNTYFVNIHFLTDQSLEGKELAKKFNVKIIPTYIIISPDRTERHRRSAYMDAESLVEWAKRGVGEKTNLHHLEQNVNKLSEWDKSELYYYYLALRDAYRKEESSQIEEMLMKCLTDNDLVKPLYWDLLESKDCRTPQFQFVLKHAKELQMNYNSKRVNSYLAKNFRDTLSKAWEQNDSLKLDALRSVRDMIASVGFPARNYWLSRVNLLYACLEKDKHSFLHNLSIIARDTNTAIGSVDDVWFWALDCVKSFQNERFTSEVLELADCLIDLYCQYRQPYMGIFLKRKITWMLDSPGIQFVYKCSLDEAFYIEKNTHHKILVRLEVPETDSIYSHIVTSKEVGDVINNSFTPISFDASTTEAKKIIERYNVEKIPCFLILDSQDSSLVAQIPMTTDMGVNEFLQQIEK